MRFKLKDINEVFHYWANQVQSEGRCGNVFFRDSMVFSYGEHFCIARLAPGGRVAFTRRSYSVSTSRHISKARQATSHYTAYSVWDPSWTAEANLEKAKEQIADLMEKSRKARKETLRLCYQSEALVIGRGANQFAQDFPNPYRSVPYDLINLDDLEGVADKLLNAREEERRKLQLLREEAAKRHAEELEKWKLNQETSVSHFPYLPVALRIHGDVIQTSYGAEIPVEHARRLWTLIEATRSSGREFEPGDRSVAVGVYKLTKVKEDGGIIVGCHDIPYSEIHRMAVELNYVEATA